MKRIAIISCGQPSTNPRMVKEYIALKEAGYQVRVFYSFWTQWATKTDETFFNKPGVNKNDFVLAAGDPVNNKIEYFLSRLIFKMSTILSKQLPGVFAKYANNRSSFFLMQAVKNHRADLYIAHTLGALPIAVEQAKANKALCGFDAEDYHAGQFKESDKNSHDYNITQRLEQHYLPLSNYITYSSTPIGDAYKQWVNVPNDAIVRNVVQKAEVLNTIQNIPDHPLKLAWFSQSIGADRGLEVIAEALNLLPGISIELHLLGHCTEEYKTQLSHGIVDKQVFFYDPVPSDAISSFLKSHHVGMATETGKDENNNLALSNKIFTYTAAGNIVVASDTIAQRSFVEQYPGIGYVYEKTDPNSLSLVLKELYENPELVRNGRTAALHAANETLNWDVERNALLQVIDKTLN